MELRTGLVGAGIVARNNHLPALDRNPRTELAAVADNDPDALADAAADYDVAEYADAVEMLERERLDWVHVATPVRTHADLVRAAVERSVPVLVQKPAATDRDELEALRRLGDRRDVPISVVHNNLFDPVVRETRRRVRSGEIGSVRAAEVTIAGEGAPDETYRGDWVLDLPGGDLGEGLPHPLYLLLAFTGYPADEAAIDTLARSVGDYDDVTYDGASAQYVTDDGTLGSVTVLAESARGTELRVFGADGALTVDLPAAEIRAHDAEAGPYHFFEERLARNVRRTRCAVAGLARNLRRETATRVEEGFDLHRSSSPDAHYYLIDEAARALLAGERPPVDLEHSRWVLAVIDRIRERAAAPRS